MTLWGALLISITFTLNVFAEQATVTRASEQLILQTDCSAASESVKAINQWAQSTGVKGKCSTSNMDKVAGTCRVDIANCVPDHVQKYHGKNPEIMGPNCWNLSMVMAGILPALRYSTPEEMAFFMGPPLCRQLEGDEKRIPGDIGAIRTTRDQGEYHGFIYINEDIAYSKNGYSKYQPYAMQSFKKVLEVYDVPDREECHGVAVDKPQSCIQSVSYYRCDSMKDYLKKNPDLPSFLVETFEGLDDFEQCLQEHAMQKSVLSPEAQKNLIDTASSLVAYLDAKVASKDFASDEKTEFLVGSLQLRLSAIAQQLSYTEHHSTADRMSGFRELISKSRNELKSQAAR